MVSRPTSGEPSAMLNLPVFFIAVSAVRLTVNLHSTTQNCRGNTQQANVTRKFRVVLTGERLRRLDNCMLSNGLLIRANAG